MIDLQLHQFKKGQGNALHSSNILDFPRITANIRFLPTSFSKLYFNLILNSTTISLGLNRLNLEIFYPISIVCFITTKFTNF